MADVLNANEVLLNGVRYPLVGRVFPQRVDPFAAKITTGDQTRVSDLVASSRVYADFRGGLLIRRQRGEQHADRFWDVDGVDTRWTDGIRLAPLANDATSGRPSVTGPWAVQSWGEYTSPLSSAVTTLFAAWWSSNAGKANVYYWNHTGGSWALSVGSPDLLAPPVSVLTQHLNNKDWLVFADGRGVAVHDGTNWAYRIYTDVAQYAPVKYLAWWDNKVWGLTTTNGTPGDANRDTGTLYSTLDLEGLRTGTNTWLKRGTLPVRASQIQGLVVGLWGGEPTLLAVTTKGLWAWDPVADGGIWVQTQISWPRKDITGAASLLYRGDLYVGVANSLFKITDGSLVQNLGWDRDGGLPGDTRGDVYRLADAFSWLAIGSSTTTTASPGSYATIHLWDGVGLHRLWKHTTTLLGINALSFNDANNLPRLWWADTVGGVWYVDLPSGVFNPRDVTTVTYAASGTLIGSWFDDDLSEVDKLALSLEVRGLGLTATSTLTLSYALNDDETTWTQLGSTLTGNGPFSIPFPNTGTPVGVKFKSLRLKWALARGGAPTDTPVVLYTTLRYLRRPNAVYSYGCTIDCTRGYDNKTPRELEAALITAVESKELVQFQFRRTGRDLSTAQYGTITRWNGSTGTGTDERGQYPIAFLIP